MGQFVIEPKALGDGFLYLVGLIIAVNQLTGIFQKALAFIGKPETKQNEEIEHLKMKNKDFERKTADLSERIIQLENQSSKQMGKFQLELDEDRRRLEALKKGTEATQIGLLALLSWAEKQSSEGDVKELSAAKQKMNDYLVHRNLEEF